MDIERMEAFANAIRDALMQKRREGKDTLLAPEIKVIEPSDMVDGEEDAVFKDLIDKKYIKYSKAPNGMPRFSCGPNFSIWEAELIAPKNPGKTINIAGNTFQGPTQIGDDNQMTINQADAERLIGLIKESLEDDKKGKGLLKKLTDCLKAGKSAVEIIKLLITM